MRRVGVALTCLLVTTGLVGLTACTSSNQTNPTTSAPVVREAGAGGFGPGQLALWVLQGVVSKGGGEGYTFLSDLLVGNDTKADTTIQKLDAIQSQLGDINTRLGNIEATVQNIQTTLNKQAFETSLRTLNGYKNAMTTIYDDYFVKVSCVARDLAAAKEGANQSPIATPTAATSGTTSTSTSMTDLCESTDTATSTTGEPSTSSSAPPLTTVNSTTTVADLSKDLETARNNFQAQFVGDNNPITVVKNQHDALYPGSGVDSVLKQYGTLLQSKGYATAADSQLLQNLYLTLSDQEALTALLILERDKMFGTPEDFKKHSGQYLQYHQQEVDNLAQQIPPYQIKVGNLMFSVPFGDRTFGAWLPVDNGRQIVGTIETTGTDPFDVSKMAPSGWTVPTIPQLAALYDGTKNVPIVALQPGDYGPNQGRSATHLGSIFRFPERENANEDQYQAIEWQRTAYWTSEISGLSNKQDCNIFRSTGNTRILTGQAYKYYNFHRVGVMTGAGAAMETKNLPDNPVPDVINAYGDDGDTKRCDEWMVQTYNNLANSAGVVVTRTVNPETDNYMAERSTAVSASPTTTTGN